MPGVAEHCFFLKELLDAQKLRRAVGGILERASKPGLTLEERKQLLTLVWYIYSICLCCIRLLIDPSFSLSPYIYIYFFILERASEPGLTLEERKQLLTLVWYIYSICLCYIHLLIDPSFSLSLYIYIHLFIYSGARERARIDSRRAEATAHPGMVYIYSICLCYIHLLIDPSFSLSIYIYIYLFILERASEPGLTLEERKQLLTLVWYIYSICLCYIQLLIDPSFSLYIYIYIDLFILERASEPGLTLEERKQLLTLVWYIHIYSIYVPYHICLCYIWYLGAREQARIDSRREETTAHSGVVYI